MEKTVKEWLNELPEPYRSQAIENCDKECPEEFERRVGDAQSALCNSFTWDESPQGADYWVEIYFKLEE
jgi:hypothetical protein